MRSEKKKTQDQKEKSEGEVSSEKEKNLAFVIRPQNSKKQQSHTGKTSGSKVCASTAECASKRGKGSDDASGITGSTFGKVRCRKVTGCAAGSCSNCKSRNCCRTFNYRKTTGYASAVSSGKAAGSTSGKANSRHVRKKPVQVQSEKEKRTENDRPARENREARQSNDRPVRENRDGKPVRDGKPSDRQGRFDRGSNDRSRQERPQGNRQFGDGRQSRGGDRDRRPGGQNGRSDREKRESRGDDVAAPIVEQQKSQRNKAKDKERDNKKKEYRDKRTGMQTVRSAIFAIVLIITGFISIIYVADNTYAADEYRVHKSEVVVKTGATYTVKILNHDTKVSPKKFKWTSSNYKMCKGCKWQDIWFKARTGNDHSTDEWTESKLRGFCL